MQNFHELCSRLSSLNSKLNPNGKKTTCLLLGPTSFAAASSSHSISRILIRVSIIRVSLTISSTIQFFGFLSSPNQWVHECRVVLCFYVFPIALNIPATTSHHITRRYSVLNIPANDITRKRSSLLLLLYLIKSSNWDLMKHPNHLITGFSN